MLHRYKFGFAVLVGLAVMLSFSAPDFSYGRSSLGLERLRQDSNNSAEVSWNPETRTASFVRGTIPLRTVGVSTTATAENAALAVVERYATLLGIESAANLQLTAVRTDELGMKHVAFAQSYDGLTVDNATVAVHISADGQTVVALSSSYVPNLIGKNATVAISAARATEIAQMALPGGQPSAAARLVIYPTSVLGSHLARAAWLVELRDDAVPSRNVYVLDASTGQILDVRDVLYEERRRETYDAGGLQTLPGTLSRSEGQGSVSDTDTNRAYDFTGATYDYFKVTHNRDSYDNAGAKLISTVHYGKGYKNAFWNGGQLVYGDGFVVNDVVAHEFTHAVTERTAGLEYNWQSGALNESFSDIFGAMVDREDWLMGEDLSPYLGGQEAIRSLADPTKFNQPAHTNNWVRTCSDKQGVHTNSGIFNKAYYNIATALDKNRAEQIFYRTLTTYLRATSSMEDARAATIQATQDLFPANAAIVVSVTDGFNKVGLDGNWNPSSNSCSCAATSLFSNEQAYPNLLERLNAATTLYRTRDVLLRSSATGMRYLNLYEAHTGRITALLLSDPDLQSIGVQVLKAYTPGLDQLSAGASEQQVLDQGMVLELQVFLHKLAASDKRNGGGELATTIDQEMGSIVWDRLIGMTFEEAWRYLNTQQTRAQIFLPLITVR